MPHTIYTSTAGWIPQGNRTVKSFASGLVLIQQDFLAPTGTGDPPELGQPFPGDTTPCIDGAYIYPAPQFSDLGNGFTRCTVTAYGRSTAAPTYEISTTVSSIMAFLIVINTDGEPYQERRTIPVLFETIVRREIATKDQTPAIAFSGNPPRVFKTDGTLFETAQVSDFFGSTYPFFNNPRPVVVTSRITDVTMNPFGEFREYTISYISQSFIDFGTYDMRTS
jgi:hypothetical protein